MKEFLFLFLMTVVTALPAATRPDYSIQAIRYANSPGFPVGELVVGAPKDEKVDIAFVVWLVRGGGRNIAQADAQRTFDVGARAVEIAGPTGGGVAGDLQRCG